MGKHRRYSDEAILDARTEVTDTVAYLRVSTEEQARADRTSMGQQRAACEQLERRLGRSIGAWFEDPGASGGSADRPGFQALVAFCRARPRKHTAPGVILCLNHSRWGRFSDPSDAVWWRQEMKHVGWLLRFSEGGGMEDSPASPILDAVHDTQASAYREAIRATAVRGWRGAAEKGFWQNEAPFGYRRVAETTDGRRRVLDVGQRKAQDERVRLTPGPDEEVALVRWLFRRYVTGELSLHRLAVAAYCRHPAKRWGAQVVRAMLRNPAYRGAVVWGRRPQLPEGGKQAALSSPETWVVTEAAHPPLVSAHLFDRVQTRFTTNRGSTRLSAGGYPLSGILTCAHCGDRLVGGGGPKGPPDDPNRYRFYRHAMLDRRAFQMDPGSHACPALMSIVPKRLVDAAVIAAVADVVTGPQMQRILARVADRLLQRLAGQPADTARDLEKRRARLLAERERLVNLVGRGLLEESEVAGRVGGIRAELTGLEHGAQQVRFSVRRLQALERERGLLLARAAAFAQTVATATGPKLREWLRPWIHSAVVDRLQNALLLTIQPAAVGVGVLDSTTWPGADSRVDTDPSSLIVRSLPLPPSRSVARNLKQQRRLA